MPEIYRGFDIIALSEEDDGHFWMVAKDGKELVRLGTIDDCYDWIDACINQWKHQVLGEVVDIREYH